MKVIAVVIRWLSLKVMYYNYHAPTYKFTRANPLMVVEYHLNATLYSNGP